MPLSRKCICKVHMLTASVKSVGWYFIGRCRGKFTHQALHTKCSSNKCGEGEWCIWIFIQLNYYQVCFLQLLTYIKSGPKMNAPQVPNVSKNQCWLVEIKQCYVTVAQLLIIIIFCISIILLSLIIIIIIIIPIRCVSPVCPACFYSNIAHAVSWLV